MFFCFEQNSYLETRKAQEIKGTQSKNSTTVHVGSHFNIHIYIHCYRFYSVYQVLFLKLIILSACVFIIWVEVTCRLQLPLTLRFQAQWFPSAVQKPVSIIVAWSSFEILWDTLLILSEIQTLTCPAVQWNKCSQQNSPSLG